MLVRASGFKCRLTQLTPIRFDSIRCDFSAKVFEEEDFDPRDYGYVLTPDVVNTKACFMLKEAEDELNKQMKASSETSEVRFHTIGTNFSNFSLKRIEL